MILGPLLTFPRSPPPLSSSPSPLQRKRSCWMRSTASSRRPTLELPRRTRSRPAPSARTATSSSRAGPASCTVANRNINSGAGSCETPNMRYRCISRLKSFRGTIKAQASNVNIGAGSYADAGDTDRQDGLTNNSVSEPSPRINCRREPLSGVHYPLSIAGVLLGCTLAFLIIASLKGGPSVLVAALAKSGFTAAFMLIFISEIGDKTFFIAALLAMQYDKALVLLGSMGALSLMTILSVVIGRIFHSVPSQFQTTLPIGEYAAVALLTLFGLNSIKNAWELPSDVSKNSKESTELGELVEAEKLVKEKVAKKLTNPLEIIWKSSSLVFFAEWGDRSMLATIALGAAQSPWGVASGAITGHLFATSIAILGGALLANYISEKLVGYLGGVLFLIFAIATLLGVF